MESDKPQNQMICLMIFGDFSTYGKWIRQKAIHEKKDTCKFWSQLHDGFSPFQLIAQQGFLFIGNLVIYDRI